MPCQITTLPADHRFSSEPGETILDAALRHGILLPYGCRDGKCGSCAATLEQGEVGYPDGTPPALDDREARICLPCKAVPESDLLIRVRELVSATRIEVRTLPCRITRKEPLNHDVMRVWLKIPDNQRLQFLAGQYIDFILRDGRRRAFSIANAPHADTELELHVRLVPGGSFTADLFERLPEKSILRLQGPLGTFVLREDSDRPILMVGGGTGLAPLKGMIEHAIHTGFERPIHLYWGVRSRRDLYLPDLPRQWMEMLPAFDYTPVLSEPDPDWLGRSGYVHQAVLEDHPDLSGFDLYMSGPPVMVEAGRRAFEAHGLPREQMFSDAFEYAADRPEPAAAPD
jgi:CDP-4-dehydro-6-deoxyglucose reductase